VIKNPRPNPTTELNRNDAEGVSREGRKGRKAKVGLSVCSTELQSRFGDWFVFADGVRSFAAFALFA
jgi:hypothetical protein